MHQFSDNNQISTKYCSVLSKNIPKSGCLITLLQMIDKIQKNILCDLVSCDYPCVLFKKCNVLLDVFLRLVSIEL